MSFDWREYKRVAQWLHDNAPVLLSSEEACYRTAISRAYYSAFQCVMDYAVEREGFPKKEKGDDHTNLLKHFEKYGKGPRRIIYLSLDRLHDNRLHADYKERLMGDPKKTSELSILEAKKVFDALDRLWVH